MTLLSDPVILGSLGYGLIVVGGAGLFALAISEIDGRISKAALGTVLAVLVIGGGGLIWRSETLRHADRDMTHTQQANLSRAIAEFPTIKFEVYALRTDREAASLALTISDAVKAAKGAPPVEGAVPSGPNGVLLVMRSNETGLARAVTTKIGRALMAARIAAVTVSSPELDDETVRIVVGVRP